MHIPHQSQLALVCRENSRFQAFTVAVSTAISASNYIRVNVEFIKICQEDSGKELRRINVISELLIAHKILLVN